MTLLNHPFLRSIAIVALAFFATHHIFDQELAAAAINNELLFNLLLAVGLFGATYEIQASHLQKDKLQILGAITFGVLLKIVFIFGVTFAFLLIVDMPQHPGPLAILILAAAMAQIDPLSVSKLLSRQSGVSERTRNFISFWASFDDPVTVIIVGSAITLYGVTGVGDIIIIEYVGLYVAMLATTPFVCRAAASISIRHQSYISSIVYLSYLAVATYLEMFAVVAMVGLFYRPFQGETIEKLVTTAFALALIVVGINLNLAAFNALPVVIGLAVFISQIFVGSIFSRRFRSTDRRRIQLAQQNGITAILLGLILVPVWDLALSTIAASIVVVNFIHAVTNFLNEKVSANRPSERDATHEG